MPHIDISCFPGRDDELKKKLADKIAQDVSEIFSTGLDHVSVSIRDVDITEWKEKVDDVYITGQEEYLFKTAVKIH